MNSIDPNLKPLVHAGRSELLIIIGWRPGIAPKTSVNYYER